jgi:ATP-dependent helicase HrpB
MEGMLSHAQRVAVEREAPSHYALPNGRRAPVDYDEQQRPLVSARVQEVFGLRATPRLARGRTPLLLRLLAPNQRPVQITDDLESFWRRTYAEVRRDLRGRYPKHAWPEDPSSAKPLVGLEHRRKREG